MKPSIECWRHSVPRAGADTSEDATAVRAEAWPVRAAVADGATESAFAGRWAECLTGGMVGRDADPEAMMNGLPEWQEQWADAVAQRTDRPWYVEAKAREGAFATLLGLEVGASGHWRAVTVGDCGLFHLRGGTLQRAWPATDPDAFTHRPALLPSRPAGPVPSPEAVRGSWAPGDAFLLTTDAVAAWLLRTDPARALHWSANAFREAVRAAQADGTLRNDDATLVVLTVEGGERGKKSGADQ